MQENKNSDASRIEDDVIVEEVTIIMGKVMLGHEDYERKKSLSDVRGAEWQEDQTDERLVIFLRALHNTDIALGHVYALSKHGMEMMERDELRRE